MRVNVGSGSWSQGKHGDCLSYLFFLKHLETYSCVENTSLANRIAGCLKGLIPLVFKALAACCVRVLGNLVREWLSTSS